MHKDIFAILERFAELSIDELEYQDGEFSLALRKNRTSTPLADSIEPAPPQKVVQSVEEEISSPTVEEKEERQKITAPLVGVFYSKPSPEAPAFVQEGDRITKGEVVCVLEAMKVFNEVKAPCDGKIARIAKKDGDLVAFEDVLFEIEPV